MSFRNLKRPMLFLTQITNTDTKYDSGWPKFFFLIFMQRRGTIVYLHNSHIFLPQNFNLKISIRPVVGPLFILVSDLTRHESICFSLSVKSFPTF